MSSKVAPALESSGGRYDHFMIRQAVHSDFAAIQYIKDTLALETENLDRLDYRLRVQASGFLLKIRYTQEEFAQDLAKIFLVYQQSESVVGFLRIDEKQEITREATAFWLRPDLRDVFFSFPHADIGGVAVLPSATQQGIATALLETAISEVKKREVPYLFSFVVFSPATNVPSMMFHERHGFERVALAHEPPELSGIKNLWSIIYGKKLSL